MNAPVPLSVLIVEHDDADAELNINALQRSGFDVHADIVGTREEFIQRVKEKQYDIVLADYRLPSWTGMDALRLLREYDATTPLILVTGTLGDERAIECVQGGVADYVLKENIGRLGIGVHRALQERRAHAELAEATARARAVELEAREQDARFGQLADSISEVFYLVQADFSRTFFINHAYERVWGRSVESLYKNPLSFIESVHGEDRAALADHVAQALRGEFPPSMEFRVVRPDGNTRWIMSKAVPIRNARGEVDRLSGVALDTTDQHLARVALQESETRFRKLVDAAFDAIAISQRGKLTEVNRGFLKMFGLASEQEAMGREVVDFCAPASRDLVSRRLSGGPEGTCDVEGIRADGSRFLIEVTARDHMVNGQPGRIAALRDVTHQRTLEEQFRQAQKMEAVGRLAGGVAHDFNNLLTVITSYAQFIHDDMSEHDPRRQDANEILSAVSGAAALTRQLLAFSRQEVIQPRTVDLRALVTSVEKMLRRLIGEDIALQTIVGDEPVQVHIDSGQFDQMMINLAVNARDAMPRGGKLTIEAGTVDVPNAMQPSAATVPFAFISVRDTGCGMDEVTRARIFEPFFTTKDVGKGTGLGLATVYGIVQQSQGQITVVSEPGRGSTFTITLPIAPDVDDQEADAPSPSNFPTGTETILVLEDAPAVRTSVRRILESQGYRVLEAPTARAALAIVRQPALHVDLLLTDVVMPEMSGREIAEQFLALRPKAKVLYMSGYTDDLIVHHGVRASGMAFIQKPFTREALARSVRNVLDSRTTQTPHP